MALISDFRAVPSEARGASVALGNFDGVHAGHRAVIANAQSVAKATGTPLAALIFEPPPRRFFRPDSPPFRIMDPEDRRNALRALGVTILFELPFSAEIAEMDPETFVRDVLVAGLGISHLSVGFDFRFGKGRAGDTEQLAALGAQYGFTVSVTQSVTDQGDKVSSTAIREALQTGHPEEAARLLGDYWRVDGLIEQGEQRGRTINFPTANLRLGSLIHPAHGVYAVFARIEGETNWRAGVANFGRTPTTGERDPLLEVHIFDFAAEIYGQKLDVAFVAFLREEKKFESFAALTRQIAADADEARDLLKGQTPPHIPGIRLSESK